MARLSSPPDSLHATPLADRTSATTTTTDSAPPMSSPTLCPLSLEASLQSHGSDNLPPSPRRRSSDRPSLLPADCHTLSKILRDVSNNPPPATPSPLEPGEQLFLETGHTSSATNDDPQDEEEGYHLVDDEAADTGYEDEDDSMELSEGVEGTTTEDTIEDVMNLPDKRALPACPSDLSRGNSHRQPVPDDIEQLNRLCLSMEKVLEDESVEQEQAECIVEPGVFIPASNVPQDVTIGVEGSDVDGFDADNEHSIAEAPWTAYTKASQDFVSKRPNCYTPALIRASPAGPALPTRCPPTAAPVSSRTNNKSYPLVPNTPTPSLKVADRDHSQLAANQSVPETPFTKTLSFFKQYKGSEDFSSKRRRNTALPQEISEVAGIAVDVKGKTDSSNEEETQNAVPPSSNTDVTPVKSAVVDLEDLMPSKVDGYAIASRTVDRIDKIGQTRAATNSTVGEGPNEGKASSEPVQNDTDTQKQLIIYPQHPAFVNAIGMIPATMFWVAAAPVVKYANIAVDLLIDKLRDTYL